ncbi:hypothetical protein PROFUN_15558 [Planoprotostelium fungivorum]|uniref:Uncharacterized protein n=1 Tax=Planoprotostelium fungivorum TaxID=1890364 RepID=A0A2P6MVD2_9EUKA|nr:hypothetical protein PROFUN_15558 [Planoprotostelium fungivorum]
MLIPLLILIALADACTYTNNDGKIFTLTSTAAWSGFIDQNQTWQLSTCAPITSGHYCWGSLVCQTWGDGDFGTPTLTPSCRISNDPILPYVPNLLASRNTSSNTTESCSYNGKMGTLITYDVMKVCRIGERVLYYSGADSVANMTVFVSPFTDHGQFTFNLPYPCVSLLW